MTPWKLGVAPPVVLPRVVPIKIHLIGKKQYKLPLNPPIVVLQYPILIVATIGVQGEDEIAISANDDEVTLTEDKIGKILTRYIHRRRSRN